MVLHIDITQTTINIAVSAMSLFSCHQAIFFVLNNTSNCVSYNLKTLTQENNIQIINNLFTESFNITGSTNVSDNCDSFLWLSCSYNINYDYSDTTINDLCNVMNIISQVQKHRFLIKAQYNNCKKTITFLSKYELPNILNSSPNFDNILKLHTTHKTDDFVLFSRNDSDKTGFSSIITSIKKDDDTCDSKELFFRIEDEILDNKTYDNFKISSCFQFEKYIILVPSFATLKVLKLYSHELCEFFKFSNDTFNDVEIFFTSSFVNNNIKGIKFLSINKNNKIYGLTNYVNGVSNIITGSFNS